MSRAARKQKRNPVEWFKGLPTWKKITLLVAIILILAVLFVGIAAYSYMHRSLDKMYEETPEDYDLSLNAVDGYINILLLGVDSRDMDNISGTRSDAIMVISINEETNDVKIISTYRDTYLKMGDTTTFDKITHACVYGGPEMTMKSLNQAMDLNIENYVVVNFKAVADLVDAVGGITVDVQDYEIQQLNKYTIQTANNIGRESYQTVTQAGTQTLDGCQAVSYSRIRKGVGDDYKRTERMRTVLTLTFNKMKTMSFSEIKGMIDMMVPQVKTNLDMNNILALASRLPSFNIQGSVGWPYNVTSGYIGSASYVLPVDLAANATRLHQEVFMQEDYTPSATLSAISNELAVRIQSARDNSEIQGEKDVEIDESNDPTQIPDNTAGENGNEGNSNGDNTTAPNEPTTPDDGTTTPSEPTTPGDGTTTPNEPTTPGDGTTTPSNPDDGTTTPSNPDDGTTTPNEPTTPNNPDGTGPVQDDPDEGVVSEPGT